VFQSRPPLWSSGQSSWLQIQRSSAFDSRRYPISGAVMGLERGPLSLVSTIEELLRRRRSDSGLENRDHSTPHYPQKLAPTSPTSRCHSVGIFRSRTPRSFFVSCYLFHTTSFGLNGHHHVHLFVDVDCRSLVTLL
jgi:hypothetical protein